MTYEIVVGALALIGALIVVVKPIINLNTNITALKSSVDQLKDILADLKERVTNHGKEIDEIREIADRMSWKSERSIRQLVSRIEPTLVIVGCLLVGLILFSVMLPLMNIMSSIGG